MPYTYQFFTLDRSWLEIDEVAGRKAMTDWPDILRKLRELGYYVLLGQEQINGIHTSIGLGFNFSNPALRNVKEIFRKLVDLLSLPFRSGEFYFDEEERPEIKMKVPQKWYAYLEMLAREKGSTVEDVFLECCAKGALIYQNAPKGQ
jgi:hypothetical protein